MSASLHHVSPLLRSIHKLCPSQGCHLRGEQRRCSGLTLSQGCLPAWPHPVTLRRQGMLCEQQVLGTCVCFVQLSLGTLVSRPLFAWLLPRGGSYPLLVGR